MAASTVFFFLRLSSFKEEYRAALCFTGLVTFIAFYHYVRIFNSWVDSYEFPAATTGEEAAPVLTGKPFNDAYRYMDWLLTVPLLLMELVLVIDDTLPPHWHGRHGFSTRASWCMTGCRCVLRCVMQAHLRRIRHQPAHLLQAVPQTGLHRRLALTRFITGSLGLCPRRRRG